jgi:hypothetical protein
VLAVSAVGSLREEIAPGHVVVPDQFIDRTRGRTRESTFFGDGVVAHVQFADPFCAALSGALVGAAGASGAVVHTGGTYVCMEGPQFSTRAESQLYRSWGADVIGMTNLQEAKLAREAELCLPGAATDTLLAHRPRRRADRRILADRRNVEWRGERSRRSPAGCLTGRLPLCHTPRTPSSPIAPPFEATRRALRPSPEVSMSDAIAVSARSFDASRRRTGGRTTSRAWLAYAGGEASLPRCTAGAGRQRFPDEARAYLAGRGIRRRASRPAPAFLSLHGRYHEDMNRRDTLPRPRVFAGFVPDVAPVVRAARYVFSAASVQCCEARVRAVLGARAVVGLDTMNLDAEARRFEAILPRVTSW